MHTLLLQVMLAKSLLLRESRRQLADSDRSSLDWAEAVVTLDGSIREGADPMVIRMLEEDLATKRAEVRGLQPNVQLCVCSCVLTKGSHKL